MPASIQSADVEMEVFEFTASPITRTERIVVLDVLRGFAMLGILVMNIQSFSMVDAAYFNPTAYGSLDGANYWVWYLSHLLADMKFVTIFSMLFGAGIVLMSGRQEAKGQPAAGLHYRRMGWLLVIGLLHAHLLWHGDILVTYALCGFVVFLLRNLSPRVLLVIGVLWFSVASGLSFLSGMSMPYWPEQAVAQFERDAWLPTAADVEREVATCRGSWLQQLPPRSTEAFYIETFVFLFFFVWRAGGLMLIGMALFKLGVLTGDRSKAFYTALIAIAALIGAPLIVLGIHRNFEAGWHVSSFFFGNQFNYWGSPLISLGYVGAIMLICKSDVFKRATWPLARVGQMALSNYLLQTLVCTFLFYGHGLGQFGRFSRVDQIVTVLVISVLQLIASSLWLHYFRFGPFEWLWRSLSYWTPQPLKLTEL